MLNRGLMACVEEKNLARAGKWNPTSQLSRMQYSRYTDWALWIIIKANVNIMFDSNTASHFHQDLRN
jgi:hypothetical protein